MQRNFLQPSSGWNTMDDDNPNKIETVYQSWQTQSPRDRTAIQPFGRHNFDVVSQEANRNRQNESFFQNFYSDYRKDIHFYYQFPKSEVQETWNYADKSDSYQAQTQNPSSQYPEYKNNLYLSNNSFPHINTSYSREYAATGTYKDLRQNSSSQYCSDTPYKNPRLWDYEDNTGTTDYPKAISLTPTTKKRQVMDKLSPFRSKRRKTSGSFIKKFGSPQKNTLDRYLVKRNLKYNPKSECVESPSSNSHLSAKCDKKEIGNVGECQEDDDDVIIVESKSRDVPIQTSVEDDNVGENQNNECHDDDLICIFDNKSSDGTRKFNQIDTCETSKEDLNQNSVTIVISDDDDFYSKSSDITRKMNEIDTCETSKENLNQNSFTIVISDDDDFDSKSSDSTRKMNQIDTCETSKENFNQNSVNSDDWHNDLKKDDIVDQNDFIINIESDVNIVSSKGNNSIISLSDDSSQSIGNGIDISPVDNLDILEIETSLPDIHYELFSCKSLGQNQSTQNLPSTDKQSNILSLTPCQNSRENQISSLIASNKCDTELNVSGTRRCDVTDQDKQIEVRPKSVSENIECLHIHKTCNAEKNILSGESKELNIYKESNKENSPSLSNKEIHHGGPGSENFAHNTEMLTSSDHFQNVSKFVVPKSETESALTNIFCVDNVGISSSNARNVNNNTNNINKNINNSEKRAFIDIDVPIVNNIGDNIFVSESSLQVKYTKTHNFVNSTSELLISNNRSANYPTNCENIPLKQCNPSSVLDSAWSSTKAVDQESCPSVDVKGSVEDSQENVKEPDTLNFRSASSSSNETNKSEFKDETMQEGHYDSSAKKPINVTPNDFIVSVQKVMFERHNEAARRMGLRRVTPCCINPYSCKKFHRSRGYEALEVCTPFGQIIVNHIEEGFWHTTFQMFSSMTSYKTYPPSKAVLLLLNYILKAQDEVYIKDAVTAIKKIIDLHPPCAPNMLKYYTNILAETAEDRKTPEISTNGILCDIITELYDVATKPVEKDENLSSNQIKTKNISEMFSDSEMEFPSSSKDLPANVHEDKENIKLSDEERMERLFLILDLIVEVIELDLAVSLVKYSSNFRAAVGHSSFRPLLVSVVWKGYQRDRVGQINPLCRMIIQLYIESHRQKFSQKNTIIINRLLNLIGELVQASDFSSDKYYPYFGEHSLDLAREISHFMKDLAKEYLEPTLSNLMPSYLKLHVTELLLNYDVSTPSLKTVIDILSVWPLVNNQEKMETATPKVNIEAEEKLDSSVHKKKNINKKNHKGETILHEVCRRNKIVKLKELLKNPELDINVVDNYGWTPLHEAVNHGNIECVKELLEHVPPAGKEKLNLRAKSHDGTTPLIDAVQQNQIDICQLLLEYGGPLLLKDKNKRELTALDVASCSKMKSILLEAKSATVPLVHCKLLPTHASFLIPVYVESYLDTYQVLKIIQTLRDLKQHKTIEEPHPCRKLKFDYPKFKSDYSDFLSLRELLRETDFRISEVFLELKILLS